MSIPFSRAALLRAAGVTMVTAATLTAALAGPARATPAAPSERSVSYRIVNDSDLRMRLTDSDVTEGVWTRSPTRLIKPDKTGSFGAESSEDRGGTGGSVTYTTTDGDVVISWDNAWLEDSDFGCEAPSGLDCRMDGDDQQTQSPHITVTIS
jgi:hypothetical protein